MVILGLIRYNPLGFINKAYQPVCEKDKVMATGTVKWFNNKKGYGFITPDEGGQDIFVHISAVQKAGMRTLNEGAKISYELMSERGKTVAGELKVAE